MQGSERDSQLDELVIDQAAGSERDTRAVEAGGDPCGRFDRPCERRGGASRSAARQLLQPPGDPGPTGDGLEQRQLERLDEAKRSRHGERWGLPPEDVLAQLPDDRRGQRAAMIGRDLAVDGHRGGLPARRSCAVDGVPENAAVLTAVVSEVHVAAGRGEPPGRRVGKLVAEDFERRGRVRGAHQGGELAVDREQRDCHGERLQHRNRGRERRHLGPAVHATGQQSTRTPAMARTLMAFSHRGARLTSQARP